MLSLLWLLIVAVLLIISVVQPRMAVVPSSPTPSTVFINRLPLVDRFMNPSFEDTSQSSSRMPYWIYRVNPIPSSEVQSSEPLCIELDTDWLWEPNDISANIPRKTVSNFGLTVDGQRFLLKDTDYGGFLFVGEGYGVFDDQNRLIGDGWDKAKACWRPKLVDGPHSATATFRTNLGIVYSYTWSFTTRTNPFKQFGLSISKTPSFTYTATPEESTDAIAKNEALRRYYFSATFAANRMTMTARNP